MDLTSGNTDLIATEAQGIVITHGTNRCAGRPCCIHNPSNHPMKNWPIVFDMNMAASAFRVCEHEFRHPDPDSLAYFNSRLDIPDYVIMLMAVHPCDGCCLPETAPGNAS